MNVAKLVETFYTIDEFLKEFMPYMEKHCLPRSTSKKPTRTCSLNMSEIMTTLITFHAAVFRNFKTYYLYLKQCHAKEFTNLASYNRFIELIPRSFLSLLIFTQSLPKTQTGCYFIDSTALKVCHESHEKKAHAHKLFKDLATKSKTTTSWFFGVK